MQVALYATLRAIVGTKTVEVDLPEGTTVQALAEHLAVEWPELHEHLLDETGRLARHVNVFVDGRNTRWLPDREKTALLPHHTIDFFPPVAGG